MFLENSNCDKILADLWSTIVQISTQISHTFCTRTLIYLQYLSTIWTCMPSPHPLTLPLSSFLPGHLFECDWTKQARRRRGSPPLLTACSTQQKKGSHKSPFWFFFFIEEHWEKYLECFCFFLWLVHCDCLLMLWLFLCCDSVPLLAHLQHPRRVLDHKGKQRMGGIQAEKDYG